MKKEKTSSYFTWICEKNGRKFVRCYKRSNKNVLHGYPRTIPVNKTLKIIKDSDIKHSKILFNSFKYIDVEYIDGTEVNLSNDNKHIIDTTIENINKLSLINCNKIMKYIKWTNNTGYLQWLNNHILKLFDARMHLKKVYDTFHIYNGMIKSYLLIKLDNNRKLQLIHGDIHRGNMILKDNNIYLLDWKLATFGDVAYEIATHFILMNYSEDEEEYFINKICNVKKYNKDSLKNDIKIYKICEYFRRVVMKIDKLISMIKQDKDYYNFLETVYKEYDKLLYYLDIKNEYTIKEFETILIDYKETII